MRRAAQLLVIATIETAQSACGVIGPSCLARQQQGVVATFGGPVEVGQVITRALRYDERGSQNDVSLTWNGEGNATGPRVLVFATGPDCVEFVPPALEDRYRETGPCRPIGGYGGHVAPEARPCALAGTCNPNPDEILYTSIIITGPGNGAPAGFSEYKLHIVGDARLATNYSVTVTYFFGPDC